MPTWEWEMVYKSHRVMTVEAETEEEARAKMDSGEWSSEIESDLYADELVKDLHQIEDL